MILNPKPQRILTTPRLLVLAFLLAFLSWMAAMVFGATGDIGGLARVAAIAPGVMALASLPLLFASARRAAPSNLKAAE